jgi:hypothetical protein
MKLSMNLRKTAFRSRGSAMPATNLLGIDLNLVDPKSAQERIIAACVKKWFEKNPSGLMNSGDCSGFVKSVQRELRLVPFVGNANSIFDEVDIRSDWVVLGTGTAALPAAGTAANSRFLTATRTPLVVTAGAVSCRGHGPSRPQVHSDCHSPLITHSHHCRPSTPGPHRECERASP